MFRRVPSVLASSACRGASAAPSAPPARRPTEDRRSPRGAANPRLAQDRPGIAGAVTGRAAGRGEDPTDVRPVPAARGGARRPAPAERRGRGTR